MTYNELVALRDKASLVAGMKYRITDYVTTTTQNNTKSANHSFDVIVEAVSENQLSELAKATQHEGDTYFDDNDLEAWQLWYDLDNDTTKYAWADAENGKGVIYRMIDEKRNDCPYDFKNILFFANYTPSTTSDSYYYTFSYVVGGVLYDGTVEKKIDYCYNNSIGIYKYTYGGKLLNRNVFMNVNFTDNCHNNTFGRNCYSNTFGSYCHSNTFGNDCQSNTFGNYCQSNTFGYKCSYNTFWKECSNNKFGNYYQSNTFGGSCQYNTFGESCHNNIFGDNCYHNTCVGGFYGNIFGNYCQSNTFGSGCNSNVFEAFCHSNTFGDNCHDNTFGRNCYSNIFGRGCNYNTFEAGLQYITLNSYKTSITLNEEYYDDGTNALVPIKHPDLSTQPSILPYKFMGQYVYEQLIPIASLVQDGGAFFIPKDFFLSKEIFVFDCAFVGFGYFLHGEVTQVQTSYLGDGYMVNGSGGAYDAVRYKYIKIVYTSIPEEGGDYYGYNNY